MILLEVTMMVLVTAEINLVTEETTMVLLEGGSKIEVVQTLSIVTTSCPQVQNGCLHTGMK